MERIPNRPTPAKGADMETSIALMLLGIVFSLNLLTESRTPPD